MLLQVLEAADVLMKNSQEQTYLVFFQTFIIISVSAFSWYLLKMVEKKNQKVEDCLKDQIKTEKKIEDYAKTVDSHLLDVHRALQAKDTQSIREIVAQLGFDSRKDL